MSSKFYNIEFPFFGLKEKPFDIQYTFAGIKIQKTEIDNYIDVDIVSLTGKNYIDRLTILKAKDYENTTNFDITARDMEELIHSNCRWGVDSNCNIFDLSNKEQYTITYKPVEKVIDNYFWIKGISYPFKIKKILADSKKIKNLWVGIMLIDFIYVIYGYEYFPQEPKRIRI